MKDLEDISIFFFFGAELRDLVFESGADESDGPMDEIAYDIVEFRVDLPLELFPCEVGVSLFGAEADECVTPVFSVF